MSVEGEKIQARSLIVAVGARHKHLGVPGEREFENRGVTFCATCVGALPAFRNKPLVVVGGGDTACEEAMYLTRFGSIVYLVHHRDTLRASKIMAERTLANRRIQPEWNSIVEEVLDVAADQVTGVRLKDVVTGETRMLECAGVFVAIGHRLNTEIFRGSSTWTTPGIWAFVTEAARMFPASLRQATAPIPSIDKPSPPQAWAAWPPLMLNAGWLRIRDIAHTL